MAAFGTTSNPEQRNVLARTTRAARLMQVILAMSAFILSHVLISRTALRPWLITQFGRPAYMAGYSVLSCLLLAWVILALLSAERTPLWPTPGWAYTFAAVTTLLAFILIAAGALSPNPFSVSFRNAGFDPSRPGIVGWTRHPLVWGLTLWGAAHVPANGEWPALLLFGGSAVFGVVGIALLQHRLKHQQVPSVTRGHIDRSARFGIALGSVLWGALLVAHPVLFGANPLALLRAVWG
ncbi:NnrU family protein [Haliea sp.]|nr:NnrU family protein [Haliea sp.]MAD62754.1 hypothetical protein [Haliea sp.]